MGENHEERRKPLNRVIQDGAPKPHRRMQALLVGVVALFGVMIPAGEPAPSSSEPFQSIIVRVATGAGDEARALVAELGGEVTAPLPLISGFEAIIPGNRVDDLAGAPSIAAATPNAPLSLSSAGWDSATLAAQLAPQNEPGHMSSVTDLVAARSMWSQGHTGQGVDIALIDSGIAPVEGLTVAGKVVNGPDLSFESQYESLRHLDTMGHGTHMAGIMAGRDASVTHPSMASSEQFVGVAPDARIVSVKVADAHGVTDVSQVIAAIDWVVQHRTDHGLNIRVLNLSFGTNSTQSSALDPLAHAVEQAWHNGIVVVVATGNDGNGHALRNPAMDPYVVAVGGLDMNGTLSKSDDFVADFSNCGTSVRSTDVVAPGRSLISLRAPGSYADVENPGAVVNERFFLGSGTSQAAAVVSGLAALLVDADPSRSPDEIKDALLRGASSAVSGSALCTGAGVADGAAASEVRTGGRSRQKHQVSTGLGSLEAARGSDHVAAEGVVLAGEVDIHGNPWRAANWSQAASALSSWDGGSWNGATWSGSGWTGLSWTGATWSSATWSGLSWTGLSWSGATWSGATWSGATWSGATWSGATWSGLSWSGATWSGLSWSGASWLGFTWR